MGIVSICQNKEVNLRGITIYYGTHVQYITVETIQCPKKAH